MTGIEIRKCRPFVGERPIHSGKPAKALVTARAVLRGAASRARTPSVAGAATSSCGAPICVMRPASITAMRSARRNASEKSCVTITLAKSELVAHRRDIVDQLVLGDRVERGKRFIHQEQFGFSCQRPRQTYPLTLPAREIRGSAVRVLARRKSHSIE